MKIFNFSERVLAFGIAMTMLLGISIPVFADEPETLNEKITNATESTTIVLDKDYMEDVIIPSGKNITLNLSGHTLRGTDGAGMATIMVEKGASLTITGEGEIVNNATGNGAACIFNNGTVVIESGTIRKETGNKSYYNIANHGTMTINGGIVINETTYVEGTSHASLVENGYYDYTSTNPILGYVEDENEAHPTLTINGGTFDGGLNSIKNDDGAILVINDATVRNQIQVAVFNVNETTINGGVFEVPAGNDKTTVFNRKYDDTNDKGRIIVNGGEFNADYFIEVINNATEAQMGEIMIHDGIFHTAKGLVNTEGRVDITTIVISGGTYMQEPSADKMTENVEKWENESGEWRVGKKVVLTLKYENDSGDIVKNYASGDEVILPDAEKEGFELEGWMKDEETIFDVGAKITMEEDLTLTAKWEEIHNDESGEVISGEESGEIVSGEESGEVISGEESAEVISGEESGEIVSGEESGEIVSGEESGEVISGEESGEVISGEESGEVVSGEESGEAISGETSGEEKENHTSGHSSNSGKTNDKEEKNEDENKEDDKKETIAYDDVKEGDWFKEYVNKATEMDLIKGVGNKKFAPNESITRGMMIEILYRYADAEEKSLTTFDDVSKDAYYAQAISWAAKNGIVKGVGDNKFEPDRYITREELATMLYRYAKLLDKDLKIDEKINIEYKDKEEISEFAMEAMIWCTEKKIIEGRGDKIVAPRENATRAEAVTMMVRFHEIISK